MKINKYKNYYEKLFFLYILSLCFSGITINVGFSIKPYMLMMIIIFLFIIISKKIEKIHFSKYDIIFLLFIAFCSLGIIFFRNNITIIRYILGMIIMFISYILLKKIVENISTNKIIEIINKIGFIFSIITIIYYLIGIFSLKFNFIGNNILKYGVLLDRNSVRLVSFASSDPNITAYIFTIFVFFFLLEINKNKNKIGFILSLFIVILTFSRGAYLAYFVTLFLFYLNKYKGNMLVLVKKVLLVVLITSIICTIVNFATSNLLFNTTVKRFTTAISDGGSGRLKLWSDAFSNFLSSPLIGIGLNNSTSFFSSNSTKRIYVHNTFLQALSETGIIGFSLYLLFIILIFCQCNKIYKNNKKYFIFICIIMCYYIQMFFLSLLIQEVFFAYLALIYRFSKIEESSD